MKYTNINPELHKININNATDMGVKLGNISILSSITIIILHRVLVKPNTTSQIWKHFGLEGDDSGKPLNADQVICRIYDVVVRTKGRSMTNLYTHLKKHHSLKYSETCYYSKGRNKSLSSSKQPSNQEAFSKSVNYQKHTRKWEQLANSVTYCLC